MSLKPRFHSPEHQAVLNQVQLRLLEPSELPRCHQLLDEHHYLKSLKPVGERLYYVAIAADGQWLALLVFVAAAKHLKAVLAGVEVKVTPRPRQSATEIHSKAQRFQGMPDFRQRVESYPLWSLLTVVALAVLCEAPRGSKDLAKFARGFNRGQRRALGIRRNSQGHYPAPAKRLSAGFRKRSMAAHSKRSFW